MGFTEETFLFIFMPFSIVLSLAVARLNRTKISNIVLVAMSLIFYAWSSIHTLLLFVILNVFVFILGNFVYSLRKSADHKELGKKWMSISAMLLILILFYYKYVPFIFQTVNSLTGIQISFGNFIVPVGISFVIFEAVSYVMDIARGEAEPGTLLDTFSFLSLFPKLVSGPIVLWKDFRMQLVQREVNTENISCGINRIIIGYAKKVVLADTFGAQIQFINQQITLSGVDTPTIWLRSILYFFQLYYDFSGYSDIAIGLCKIFGFSFKENFNFPYRSKSVTEFWRRWHISLGSWFREYVYIPLGGNQRGNVYLNLLIVFLLTGIWHGANWTFFLWGGANGIFVVLERFLRKKGWDQKIPLIVRWCFTQAVIFFAWILFMSPDLKSAGSTYMALFSATGAKTLDFTWRYYLTNKIQLLLIIAGIGAVVGVPLPKRACSWFETDLGCVIQKAGLLLLFVLDVLFIVNATYSPFMYFQF